MDRLGLHAALAMFACALMASSGPASAYFVDETRFADGSPTFSTTITGRWDMGGPGLRLFTNSSVIEATMVVEGGPHRVTQNVLETSSVDFSSNLGASGVRIASGSLSLDQSTGAVVLNAANAFSVDSSTGVAVFGENLTLDNASAGSLLTSNLSAPPAGWGHLSLLGHLPAGSSLSVDLLSPTGALLVASQAVGTRINLDALAYPLVRLSLSIDAPSPLQSPQIREITLGQRVADSFAFSSPTHTVSDLVPTPTGALTQVANTASLSRAPQNPLLNVAPSTFYSETVHVPQVIRVGSEWWAYFMGTNINGATQGQIGLAVSTDLTTWTVRPTPVLSATPGSWAATSLSEPFVMRDPDSSGYLMFFEGWNATPIGIGLAFSPDGINWTQFAGNPVITPTAATWDSGFVGEIAHVEVVNGTWRLWYSGRVPGGFRQLGMSSSSDGRNWTKYAGNPVISPTPGGPDAEEAASGTIAMVNGSYLMYYSCTPGMTGFGICMATSTDGVSWAKAARAVLTATGGWEGADIAVGSVVQYNGTLSLFYEGFQNGVIRSGRADAVWSEGTVTTVTDLGAGSPYALLTLSESGSVPPGGSLQVLLSSSPDGVSWSPFENMSAKTAIQTTPANRFVRSLITLRAPVRTNAAVLRSTALSYSDLSLVGIYNSSLFAHSMPAVAVTPTLTLGASSDPVTLRLSNDGGTTWEPAASGVAHVFSSSGATVAYSLDFEPVAGRSPVVDAVELAIELESWPANVTLRLGATAAPFANLSGPLVGAVTVAWPVDELNALIAGSDAPVAPPAADSTSTA